MIQRLSEKPLQNWLISLNLIPVLHKGRDFLFYLRLLNCRQQNITCRCAPKVTDRGRSVFFVCFSGEQNSVKNVKTRYCMARISLTLPLACLKQRKLRLSCRLVYRARNFKQIAHKRSKAMLLHAQSYWSEHKLRLQGGNILMRCLKDWGDGFAALTLWHSEVLWRFPLITFQSKEC